MRNNLQQGLVQKINNFFSKKDSSLQPKAVMTLDTLKNYIERTSNSSQLRFLPINDQEVTGVCISNDQLVLDDVAVKGEEIVVNLSEDLMNKLHHNEPLYIERYVIRGNNYVTTDYFTTDKDLALPTIPHHIRKTIFAKEETKKAPQLTKPALSKERVKTINLYTAKIQHYISQAEELTGSKNTFTHHYFKEVLDANNEVRPNKTILANDTIASFEKRKCFLARRYVVLTRNKQPPDAALASLEKRAQYATIEAKPFRNKNDIMELLLLTNNNYDLNLPEQEVQRQAT